MVPRPRAKKKTSNPKRPRLFGAKGAQEEKDGAVWFHNHPSSSEVQKAQAANPLAKLWGGVAPELQELSEITGCPLYFTPPKYWPEDLAKSYITGKKVFGIVRNPIERLVAMFRGGYSEYGSFPPRFRETCDVNPGLFAWLFGGFFMCLIPRPSKECFLEVFCYIKPTKKHGTLGVLVWLSLSVLSWVLLCQALGLFCAKS